MTSSIAVRRSSGAVGYRYPISAQEVDVHEVSGYRRPSALSDEDRRTNVGASLSRPGEKPIVTYTRRLLLEVGAVEGTGLTFERIHLLCRLIDRISTHETIFPAITPDFEGGISLEWSSGALLIELSIESNGTYALFAEGVSSSSIHHEGDVHDMSLPSLKALIARFTDEISTRNPDWREHF